MRQRIEAALGEPGTPDAPNSGIWAPLPGRAGKPSPQQLAIESQAFILGFGGSAGGGKSDVELGLAITRHRRSIIFRREYPQLKGLVDRSREILAEYGRFNGHDNVWRLRDGRMVEFGAMQYEHDREKYRGRPHDFYAFDEASEFLESQVRFTIAWCRTSIPDQRCRVLLAFNPPTTPEGEWIIRFFAPWLDRRHPNPARPGELRWFAMLDGIEQEVESGEPFDHKGETIFPTSRTFVPARLEDNPIYEKSGYRAVLQSMPEPLRSQLLYGDFTIGLESDPWQVIPTAWVEAAMNRWTPEAPTLPTCYGMDVAHGGKDQTVIAARHGNWFAELIKKPGRETPSGMTAAVVMMQAYEPEGEPYVNVDAIGYGASAAERLAELPPEGFGLNALPVNVGSKSTHTDRSGKFKMRNLRAEMYWRLRESLDPEYGDELALPPDAELKSDLCAPRYRVTPSGIQVEEKADIIERIGRSPDAGDACALAMLPPDVLPFVVAGADPFEGVRWGT